MSEQMMQKLFAGLIVIIIMLALTPVIISFTGTSDLQNESLENLSASAKTIVSLIPLFWIIACLGVVVALLYFAFKAKH